MISGAHEINSSATDWGRGESTLVSSKDYQGDELNKSHSVSSVQPLEPLTFRGKLFLNALGKLRKTTISFLMSVFPHTTTRPAMDGFL
jgi:hypothetical protein